MVLQRKRVANAERVKELIDSAFAARYQDLTVMLKLSSAAVALAEEKSHELPPDLMVAAWTQYGNALRIAGRYPEAERVLKRATALPLPTCLRGFISSKLRPAFIVTPRDSKAQRIFSTLQSRHINQAATHSLRRAPTIFSGLSTSTRVIGNAHSAHIEQRSTCLGQIRRSTLSPRQVTIWRRLSLQTAGSPRRHRLWRYWNLSFAASLQDA